MSHPAILESIRLGGELVDLTRCPSDWRDIRDASDDGNIDHENETTTYRGTYDGDPWEVRIHADQPREGGFPGHDEDA